MNNDILKEMMIKQGYVPKGCKMRGDFIMMLMNTPPHYDPCIGCNLGTRELCKKR